MFVLLGTLALGVFADGKVHTWALSTTIIGATLYRILAVNPAINDLSPLREDMDDETKKNNYGISVLSAPLPIFRAILIIVYLAIVSTQLLMLHA